MSHKSIGPRLKKAKTYETQSEVLADWVENWKTDQLETIRKLKWAVVRNDKEKAMQIIGQLEGLSDKRFGALENVLKTLSDPERKLKTMEEVQRHEEEYLRQNGQ